MSEENHVVSESTSAEIALEQAIEERAEEIAAVDVAAAEALAASAHAEAAHIQEHAASVVANAVETIERTEEQTQWQIIQAELQRLREQNTHLQTLLQTQTEMMMAFSAPLLQLVSMMREEMEASSKSTPPRSAVPQALEPEALTPNPENGVDENPAPQTSRKRHRLI